MYEGDAGQELYADSAYIGKGVKRIMRKYNLKNSVIKRNVKGKKLSKRQDTINRMNSQTRVRVEHVFGFIKPSRNVQQGNRISSKFGTNHLDESGLQHEPYEQIARIVLN